MYPDDMNEAIENIYDYKDVLIYTARIMGKYEKKYDYNSVIISNKIEDVAEKAFNNWKEALDNSDEYFGYAKYVYDAVEDYFENVDGIDLKEDVA